MRLERLRGPMVPGFKRSDGGRCTTRMVENTEVAALVGQCVARSKRSLHPGRMGSKHLPVLLRLANGPVVPLQVATAAGLRRALQRKRGTMSTMQTQQTQTQMRCQRLDSHAASSPLIALPSPCLSCLPYPPSLLSLFCPLPLSLCISLSNGPGPCERSGGSRAGKTPCAPRCAEPAGRGRGRCAP